MRFDGMLRFALWGAVLAIRSASEDSILNSPTPIRGRPVDPTLEPRVFAATRVLYKELGWAGLTIDGVARAAKVGKAAIYKRWPSKEALIADTLKDLSPPLPDFGNTGSLRGDLVALAVGILRFYAQGYGLIVTRLRIEAKLFPEVLGKSLADWERSSRDHGRKMILQAMERREIPKDVSPALILDLVAGALLNHFLYTPNDKMELLQKNCASYAETVVDFVLRGVDYRHPAPDGKAQGAPARRPRAS
ncbi:TetR/AcrR family transcriptional regulator [Achromobacter sp. Marseille-Q4954]|uniref:TetR/AcrR family transcriptional regulator n=1 Tax=Achromobacter sp. Marseille-Q4954 TaxID=2942203 RepID=UPI0020730C60|nr:TetR/AcrR family transcriptional regulator [Achromobacter sp. Marseille-Q4954]